MQRLLPAEAAALRRATPSVACGDSSPKGTPYGNAGNFIATAKSRPLGEGGIAAGDDGRGISRGKRPCA